MDDLFSSATKRLQPLAGALPGAGFWLVGGSVRDLLLNRVPVDYDIAVDGNPAQFAAAVAGRIGGRPVSIGPAGRRIHRLSAGGDVFDFSRLAGSDIEEDLRRRDFTVNAMAYDAVAGKLIDPLRGRQDLTAGLIRMVSDGAFRQDPVRLVRAFRMSAVFGLALEAETESCIRRNAARVGDSAGERVRDELYKLLAVDRSEKTVTHMNRCGLLGRILPEVAALKSCRQNRHHRYDVLTHTLLALSHLESILTEPRAWIPRGGAEPAVFDLRRNPVPLKFAVLLHDIGKPAARGITRDGRIHFRGHPQAGARAAGPLFERLRLSNRHRAFIDFMIRHHIRPLQLFIAHRRGTLTEKGRTRFFIRCGEMTPALLLLALADTAGKQTPPGARFREVAEFVGGLFDDYVHRFRPKAARPPLIGGRDLIDILGLSPSPAFGRILARIEAERLEGRLETRDEALARARELFQGISGR